MTSLFESGVNNPFSDRGPKLKIQSQTSKYNTITNLPFRHMATIQKRYELINRPVISKDDETDGESIVRDDKTPSNDDSGQNKQLQVGGEYVRFLRDHKRTAITEGFLDSNRHKNSYRFMSRRLSLPKNSAKHSINFQSVKQSDRSRPKTAVEMTRRSSNVEGEFKRRMHVIENHIYKHKQDERNLNRLAYDVGKSKIAIERIRKNIIEEGEQLLEEQNKKIIENKNHATIVRAQGIKAKENVNKIRVQSSHSDIQKKKYQGRQAYNLLSNKERMYAAKSAELQSRQKRIEEISKNAEKMIRKEEVEANSIQKQLAELALQIGMEGIKSKSNSYDFERTEKKKILKHFNEDSNIENNISENLKNTSIKIRKNEFKKRQASAMRDQKLERVNEKLRDGERKLKDMNQLVSNNVIAQKRLIAEKEHGKLEHKKNLHLKKLERGHSRKTTAINRAKAARSQMSSEREDCWSEKYKTVQNNYKMERNKELIRGLRKVVRCDDQNERKLEQLLKRHSAETQVESNNVRKLQIEMIRTRAELDRSTQQAVTEANVKMRQLEAKLHLAKSKLTRSQNQVNAKHLMLKRYESSAKESKMMYKELEKSHQRLVSINEKTNEKSQ